MQVLWLLTPLAIMLDIKDITNSLLFLPSFGLGKKMCTVVWTMVHACNSSFLGGLKPLKLMISVLAWQHSEPPPLNEMSHFKKTMGFALNTVINFKQGFMYLRLAYNFLCRGWPWILILLPLPPGWITTTPSLHGTGQNPGLPEC